MEHISQVLFNMFSNFHFKQLVGEKMPLILLKQDRFLNLFIIIELYLKNIIFTKKVNNALERVHFQVLTRTFSLFFIYFQQRYC